MYQPANITEFKKNKTLGDKCVDCQKEVKLEAYRAALSEIIEILLELPV